MKHFRFVILVLCVFGLVSCGRDSLPQETSSILDAGTPTESVQAATDTPEASAPSATAVPTQVLPSQTPTPQPSPLPTATIWIPQPWMGTEPHNPERESTLSMLTQVGAQIIRFNGVVWHVVEPQEGQYDWSTLQNLDTALQELAAREIEVILIVRGTPDWAQKIPGSACGPISEEKFAAFAAFLSELVRRYSVPPYNVKYWELGNEPDVAPELVPSNYPFGCWGDSQDSYYGGGYYAKMLKVAYPAIKAVDPSAQVLIGGLLLDCDPDFPPEGRDCQAARFFNGILANGGGEYFDAVSFHGYVPYLNQSISQEWESPGWQERGGPIVGKIDFLRDVMQPYGLEKPLFLTETALICPEWNKKECQPPDEHFYQAQASYLVRLFVRNWALDVAGTIWYDFEGKGWRYGGLVGEDANNPKPAFRAFQYLNEKLAGMAYVGEAPLPQAVSGYIFTGDDHQTWVIWSVDDRPQSVELPPNVTAAFDQYGQTIPLEETQWMVSAPIYLDVEP